jgi:hypothetical protein
MHGMKKYLRFYPEGRGEEWEAICLDLDLAVQGRNMAEVVDSMSKAVEFYVEEAMKLPEPDRARLLNRQAPLGLRLRFLWSVILALFNRSTKSGTSRVNYLAPFPA